MTARSLKGHAQARFKDLSPSELALLQSVQRPSQEKPKDAQLLQVRAAVIRWLCTESKCAAYLPSRGIEFRYIKITGGLDLQAINIDRPLVFEHCAFENDIELQNSSLPHLRILNCHAKALNANYLNLDGALVLNDSTFEGPVKFLGSRLHGAAHLSNTSCRHREGAALNFEGATIDGSLVMGGHFLALGTVRIFGARIGGAVECSGTIVAPEVALLLEATTVSRSVLFRRGFRSLATVRIYACHIMGALDVQAAKILSREKLALLVYDTSIARSLLLNYDSSKPRMGHGTLTVGAVVVELSTIGGNVNASRARIRASRSQGFSFFDTTVKGRLIARGLDLIGSLSLTRTKIGNDLELHGITVEPRKPTAIFGAGLECEGKISLQGAKIKGFVDLSGVKAGDDISAEGLRITDTPTTSMSMSSGKIVGSLNLAGSVIEGRTKFLSISIGRSIDLQRVTMRGLDMVYASIGGNIWLNGAHFAPKEGAALTLDFSRVGNAIAAPLGFKAERSVTLNFLTAQTHVILDRVKISVQHGISLCGEALDVGGTLSIENSEITGTVELRRLRCGGGLNLRGTKVKGHDGKALLVYAAAISGGIRMSEGFTSRGLVTFVRASILGDLQLGGSRLYHRRGKALSLAGARIDGSIAGGFFYTGVNSAWSDTRILGDVDLSKATVSNDVDFSCTSVLGRQAGSLDISRTAVSGTLYIDHQFRTNGHLLLNGAEIHAIEDLVDAWPRAGRLNLDGLTYTRIAPLDATNRSRWIDLRAKQTNEDTSWQPYDQLGKVLRQQGREREARQVMIAREQAKSRQTVSAASRLLRRLYGLTMGYGYEPQRAAWAAPLLIAITAAVFYTGGDKLMAPTNDLARKAWAAGQGLPEGYPQFSPLAYATDTLVPILSLQQKDAWRPMANVRCNVGIPACGKALRIWLWFYIAAGWAITTLAVAGFTGLIRKT